MTTLINKSQKFYSEKILIYLFCLYPLGFLIGNSIINLTIVFIAICFFLLNWKKKIIVYKDQILLILIFFFLSLLINLIFSTNQSLSIFRVVKFLFIILFIFAFRYILEKEDNTNIILKFWSAIIAIVIFDLIFEFIFGRNIIGLKSIIPGRLASFTGGEMVIGHFFSAFCLIILSFFKYQFPKKRNYLMILSIFFILISFFIGERSNFVKTFIMISLFILFLVDYKIKFKISLAIIILFFMGIFLSTNKFYKKRYFDQMTDLFKKDGINNYLANSQYGAHYDVAYEIFRQNKIFGVGIKNFRKHSFDTKYINQNHIYKDWSGATHPHQIHYEFLSETGLFGYISFLIFIFFSFFISIKSYLYNKNYYQFSGFCYVAVSILPLIPSGSFFSTFSSGLFWINYAFMTAFLSKISK